MAATIEYDFYCDCDIEGIQHHHINIKKDENKNSFTEEEATSTTTWKSLLRTTQQGQGGSKHFAYNFVKHHLLTIRSTRELNRACSLNTIENLEEDSLAGEFSDHFNFGGFW